MGLLHVHPHSRLAEIPQSEGAVPGGGDHNRGIGSASDVGELVIVPGEGVQLLASVQVVDAAHTIPTTGNQLVAVGEEVRRRERGRLNRSRSGVVTVEAT